MATLEERLAYLPRFVQNLQRAAPSSDYSFLAGVGSGSSAAASGITDTNNDPWWMDTLNALGAFSAPITNQTAAWTDGRLGWSDVPGAGFAKYLSDGLRGQWANWTDSRIGFEDIPILGGMAAGTKRADTFERTLTNLGVPEGSAAARWGGVAGDILLDPTTYLTFGAGSLAKASAQAGRAAATEAAARFGARAGRTVDSTLENIYQTTLQRSGSEAAAQRALDVAQRAVDNASKAARNVSQNALVNIDIPFTRFTRSFGTKSGPLRITEDIITRPEAIRADEMLSTLGQSNGLLQRLYGVSDVSQLNRQQFRHLQDNFDRLEGLRGRQLANDGTAKAILDQIETAPKRVGTEQRVTYNPYDINAFIQTLDPRIADRIAPYLRSFDGNITAINRQAPEGLEMFGRALGSMPGTIKGRTADAIRTSIDDVAEQLRNADNTATIENVPVTADVTTITPRDVSPEAYYGGRNVADRFTEFVQDSGGKSDIRRRFENTVLGRAFNTRPNYATSAIKDAETAIYGGRRLVESTLRDIEQITAGLTERQRLEIPHVVERTRAASSPQVQAAADRIRQVLDSVAEREIESGVLQQTRRGYFPHVLTDGAQADRLQQLANNDPELERLIGRSQSSQFSKERRSFQTLAQVDNYLGKMEERIQKASGAERDELIEKRDLVANLFERDPIAALRKRLNKSVQANAMKKLYNQFERDGLIYKPDKVTPQATGADFERIDAATAARLGLERNSYVHKDVMQGLQRVNEMFTDENTNKLLQRIDTIVGWWKTLVTTSNPSHHLFNLIGNVANNSMAGVSMRSYSKAYGILQRMRNGTLSKAERETVAEALEKGVLYHGDTSEFAKTISDQLRLPLEGLPVAGKYITFMRKLGDNIDNITRLAHYVDKKAAYRSVDKAADSVQQYLFNYRDMTTTDRVARLLAPFWNWTRRNLPLQLSKLMQTPRFANTYARIREQLEEDATARGDVPEYMSNEGLFIPGLGVMVNPRLPMQDLSQLSNPLRMAANMTNPLIRTPFEYSANSSAFTGRPIDWDFLSTGERNPQTWADYFLRQTGAIGRGVDLLNPNTEESFAEKLLQLFIGSPTVIEGE